MKRINCLPLFVLLVFASCKKVDITFGTEFIDTDYTQLVKVDSFGVELSSINIDSFVTSGLGTALIGSYTDPVFGKITARTYLQVSPIAYSDIYQNTIFDSLTLIGKANGNYYGDTTQALRINVARLAEDIVPPTTGTVLYNVNTFTTYSSLLGSKDVFVRPNAGDTFSIRISDALGNELLGMMQRKSDTIKTSTVFLNYFKGLCLSGSSSNAMILGISDSIKLRLHYKQSGLFVQNKTVDFAIANTSLQFNNITVDRTGTPLQNLNTVNNQISSNLTNHVAYSQPTSSVMLKMRFPTVKEILKFNNYKKMLKAQLVIRPAIGSYSSLYSLPPQLRLSRTTQLNQLGEDLTATSSSGASETQYGNLVVDYLYGKDTYYTYDVTSYIQEVMATEGYTQNGLLLLTQSPASNNAFNRIVVGDRNNGEARIELQVFYVTVQ
jgi:hypothetical protein